MIAPEACRPLGGKGRADKGNAVALASEIDKGSAAVEAGGRIGALENIAKQRLRRRDAFGVVGAAVGPFPHPAGSEEHTSELQSLMRISYAVFCLKNKTQQQPVSNTYMY